MEGNTPVLEEGALDQYKTFHTFGSSSTVLDQSPFPEKWKKEKTCAICEVKLTTARGDQLKRHGCKFCLHAVCQKCSPLRCLHGDSGRQERICSNCFRAQIEDRVREELTVAKTQREAEWLELSSKLTEESKRCMELELSLAQLRFTAEENVLLQTQLEEETRKLRETEMRLSHIQGELATLKFENTFQEKNFETSLMALQQSVDKYRKTLVLKSAELMGARRQLEDYKALVEQLKSEKGHETVVKPGASLLAVAAANQLHAMQLEEVTTQVQALRDQVALQQAENEALAAKLRESEAASSAQISTMLQDTQGSLRKLTDSEKENELLKEEAAQLREQLERVGKNAQLDTDSLFRELKLTYERRAASLKDSLEAEQKGRAETETRNELLRSEIQRLNEQLEEQCTLLALAKEDVLAENQLRVECEEKMKRFESYLDKLEEIDSLNLKVKEQATRAAAALELIERQRLELEQYKQQLITTQEALEKSEELIRAGLDQHQIERKVIARRDSEIECLRKKLLNHGIDATGLFSKIDGETELTRLLRDKEARVGKLGEELQENMQKVRAYGARRSRPSGGSKGVRKPPVSTDPCACSIF